MKNKEYKKEIDSIYPSTKEEEEKLIILSNLWNDNIEPDKCYMEDIKREKELIDEKYRLAGICSEQAEMILRLNSDIKYLKGKIYEYKTKLNSIYGILNQDYVHDLPLAKKPFDGIN